jgi:hypothetical protein
MFDFIGGGVSNSGVVERTKDRGCRISLLTELVCKRKPSSFDLAIKLLTQMTLLKRQGFTFARDTKTLFICFFDGELTGSIRLSLAARLAAHPQMDRSLRHCAVSLPAAAFLRCAQSQVEKQLEQRTDWVPVCADRRPQDQ